MNKNKCEVSGIIKLVDGEYLLLKYLPEPDDPKFDDLPSELLTIGKQYYLRFTPVENKEEPFNQ